MLTLAALLATSLTLPGVTAREHRLTGRIEKVLIEVH
jgi:hypothetical protein